MPGDPTAYGARGKFRVRNRRGQFVEGGFGIEWVGLELLDGMFAEYGDAMHAARVQVGDDLGRLIEDYMKRNAPWDDRTTKAREGLKTTVVHEADVSTVYAGASADTPYVYFLENYTYNGVSYAIIRPTIEKFSDDMGGMIKEAV